MILPRRPRMADATDMERPEGSCLTMWMSCLNRRKDKTSSTNNVTPTSAPGSADPNMSVIPRPRDATFSDPGDLWWQAYERLDEKTRKGIPGIPANPSIETSRWMEDLVKIVREREEQYKSETPKLSVAGREIIWRDYAKKVVAIVTIIGDISINFAPAPSSLAWSAVKTLMQVGFGVRVGVLAVPS